MNQELPLRSISEVTAALRRTLEGDYGRVRVRGEISNWRPAASGHAYFVLKDERAQLRAVLFRGDSLGLRFTPAEGLEVEAEGEITLYEARGDLQILVRRMVPSGVGALLMALEALKRRLAAEGLFDAGRKRSLPRFPRVIGVVTSPTGAAVRDILKVLGRRWPLAQIVFHPVLVQGAGAAAEIARALDRMSRWGGADVIILGRGGGSLEDLWAFNEEAVVRAIAASRTPVVSAVGHETDVTLADLVADVRAPTPSAAAELVVPDAREIRGILRVVQARMRRRLGETIAVRRSALEQRVQAYGFRRPERFLERRAETLDHATRRLEDVLSARLAGDRETVHGLARRLTARHPARSVAAQTDRLRAATGRLRVGVRQRMQSHRDRLAGSDRALRALDPTRVLDRGYALVRRSSGGPPVIAAGELARGDSVTVQFTRDRFHGRVEGVEVGGPWVASGEEIGLDEHET